MRADEHVLRCITRYFSLFADVLDGKPTLMSSEKNSAPTQRRSDMTSVVSEGRRMK